MAFDFSQLKSKLQKALEHVKKDIGTLRTGKASVQTLDPVVVEVYGSQMKVNELANISAPDANMILIQPWDSNVIENIEKAIASSGLNLNPVVDGDVIRITIPPLTQERRQEMVKILHQKIEQGRVMVRNIRNEIKQAIEDMEGSDGISEDDVQRDLDEMEKKIKDFEQKLEQLAKDKETELMKV